jgi:hypothetical protein
LAEKLGLRDGLEEGTAFGCSAAGGAGAGAGLGSLSAAAAAFCLYLFKHLNNHRRLMVRVQWGGVEVCAVGRGGGVCSGAGWRCVQWGGVEEYCSTSPPLLLNAATAVGYNY